MQALWQIYEHCRPLNPEVRILEKKSYCIFGPSFTLGNSNDLKVSSVTVVV